MKEEWLEVFSRFCFGGILIESSQEMEQNLEIMYLFVKLQATISSRKWVYYNESGNVKFSIAWQ